MPIKYTREKGNTIMPERAVSVSEIYQAILHVSRTQFSRGLDTERWMLQMETCLSLKVIRQ